MFLDACTQTLIPEWQTKSFLLCWFWNITEKSQLCWVFWQFRPSILKEIVAPWLLSGYFLYKILKFDATLSLLHLNGVTPKLARLFLVLWWSIFDKSNGFRKMTPPTEVKPLKPACETWSPTLKSGVSFTSQQRYYDVSSNNSESVMETFYVFFSNQKQKLKAIICALPQGGHLTGNNYVVVAERSCLPIWESASVYTVYLHLSFKAF